MTTREFNRNVSAAKREAAHGPVIITDRGEPAYVLLSVAQYHRLSETGTSLVERLSMKEDSGIDMTPVQINLAVPEL
ncbi:type II toxin-antitoxin system prevent-host-death family antitoxin [Actinomyces wuliandei]|uniref:type II toxin-antitoxin system prevent-host-death family antitoxin n=1 Tax=Actinomyces wuliandei TaxID=2057743 RepID=UPI001FA9B9D5|nr:type II toxin-antitoxin system prevent-host-death family antitoxin [Actinomyces wuliandei]